MTEAAIPRTQERYDSEADCYTVIAGNKTLRILFGESEISTHILNINRVAGPTSDNSPGDTTAVYARARALMQQRANDQGKSLTYTFVTTVPSMIGWAMEKGQEIYGWQSDLSEGIYEATKVFTPENPLA